MTHFITSVGGLIVSNSFQHVALAFDRTSGLAKLYLNGTMGVCDRKVT
jgi:hypothetical protein